MDDVSNWIVWLLNNEIWLIIIKNKAKKDDHVIKPNEIKKENDLKTAIITDLKEFELKYSNYAKCLIPINRRLNEKLEELKNYEKIVKNLQKSLNVLNSQSIEQQQYNHEVNITIDNNQTQFEDTSSYATNNVDESEDDDDYYNNDDSECLKIQYLNICKMLKGSKLIQLNKFYMNNLSNINETIINQLSNEINVDSNVINTFIKCKQNLKI